MAMNAAAATASLEANPSPGVTERAGVLGLVRRLIAYGRELVASLQDRDDAVPPPEVARCFGSLNLALIIARITRGLMLAQALERRLRRPCPTPPPPSCSASRPMTIAPRAPRRPRPNEAEELLRGLPTAREIARRVRGRPIGAVIQEICRDLGISGEHPLWDDVLRAITCHGGSRARMLEAVFARAWDGLAAGVDYKRPDLQDDVDRLEAMLSSYARAAPPH
jgi:hypothetical protein